MSNWPYQARLIPFWGHMHKHARCLFRESSGVKSENIKYGGWGGELYPCYSCSAHDGIILKVDDSPDFLLSTIPLVRRIEKDAENHFCRGPTWKWPNIEQNISFSDLEGKPGEECPLQILFSLSCFALNAQCTVTLRIDPFLHHSPLFQVSVALQSTWSWIQQFLDPQSQSSNPGSAIPIQQILDPDPKDPGSSILTQWADPWTRSGERSWSSSRSRR